MVSYATHAKFDKDPSSINPCTHVPMDPKTSNSLVEKSIENRVMQNTYQNGPWTFVSEDIELLVASTILGVSGWEMCQNKANRLNATSYMKTVSSNKVVYPGLMN